MNILIIPGCDDTNRGDQALIWESARLARDAGFEGQYFMISTDESSAQSRKEGIDVISYILPHPSSHFKHLKDNRHYGIKLKLLWGIFAICDFCIAFPLMVRPFRKIARVFISKEKKKSLLVFEKADVAIVKGGGFLHSSPGLAEVYKIFFFLYHINLAHSMRIPVVVMPNSFGAFGNSYTRRMVRKSLKKCVLVTSRESISHDVLKEDCGVESTTTMDLGAYLQVDKSFDAEAYLVSKGIDFCGKKSVVITVRPYRFPGCSNPTYLYDKYVHSISKMIQWLDSQGYFSVLVEHVYSENYHESDKKAIEDVASVLADWGIQNYAVLTDHSLTCRDLKSIYSCFDYMIGTRFHSVIFAIFAGIPSIAITYGGNKGTGIMQDLGMSDFSIPIEVIDSTILIDTFQKLVANKDFYLKTFEETKKTVLKQREQLIGMVKEAVGGD